MLQTCTQLLKNPIGSEFPALKYKTYNNIAHLHNVQGQVKLSIKYLIKALKFALAVPGLENIEVSYVGPDKIPVVETYVNICNAYSFQGFNDEALEYSEGAITMSERILETLFHRFECAG